MNTESNTENPSTTGRSTPKRKSSGKKGKATQAADVAAKATVKDTAKRRFKKSSSPAEGRGNTKKAIVLELLHLKEGATIGEIAKATECQNHSMRAFLSSTAAKKMGLVVEWVKNQADERTDHVVLRRH
jgi:hypothetical protein